MRIETTMQELRPKDQSIEWKKRIRTERESSKLISVGNNAPIKHVRYLIQKYGITLTQIADVLGVS